MKVPQTSLWANSIRDIASPDSRRAATLVAVLIVMMIVGLLTAQSVRTMVAIRQGDQQRAQLRQARELVELARHTLENGDESVPLNSFEIPLPGGESAKIEFESSSRSGAAGSTADQKTPIQEVTRIVARYRASPEREFVATQTLTNQTEAQESIDD
ncbi:MAG: type II secretion system protein [Pirellulaceae bacterium]